MDCITPKLVHLTMHPPIVNLYCALVLKWYIFSSTTKSTWKFLSNNGKCKYKCSFEWIWDNVIYVNPCFVTPWGSKARDLSVKNGTQCMVQQTTSWIKNWILAIIWYGLFAYFVFLQISIQLVSKIFSSVMKSSYVYKYWILILIPICGL